MKRIALILLVMLLLVPAVGMCIEAGTTFKIDKATFIGSFDEYEIPDGWYKITPISPKDICSAAVFDYETTGQAIHIADYVWFYYEGEWCQGPSGEAKDYYVPLWEGCIVIPSYKSGFRYDTKTEKARYNLDGYKNVVQLEYIGPLTMVASDSTAPSASGAVAQNNDDKLLYEDENISITYCDLYVKSLGSTIKSNTLTLKLLFQNKTDSTITVISTVIVVNGYAVAISSFVDIPANSTFIKEWGNNADTYLEYGITDVGTFSMLFDYRGKSVKSKNDIQSKTIELK